MLIDWLQSHHQTVHPGVQSPSLLQKRTKVSGSNKTPFYAQSHFYMNIFRGKIWETNAYTFLKYVIQKKIPMLCLRPKSLSLSSLKPPALLIILISSHDNTPTQSSKIETSATFDSFSLTSRTIIRCYAVEISFFFRPFFNLFPNLNHHSHYWFLPGINCNRPALPSSSIYYSLIKGN